MKWSVRNTELPTSGSALGVVPYLAIAVFTIVVPFGITLSARWLCSVPHRRGDS